jgi:hypothetical protein
VGHNYNHLGLLKETEKRGNKLVEISFFFILLFSLFYPLNMSSTSLSWPTHLSSVSWSSHLSVELLVYQFGHLSVGILIFQLVRQLSSIHASRGLCIC